MLAPFITQSFPVIIVLNSHNPMQAKRCQFTSNLGNFQVTGTLISGTKLKLQIVSNLDGRIYCTDLTDQTLDKSIQEFFGNVSNVYAVIEDQIKGKKDIVATDSGTLKFSIVIYKAGNTEIKKDFVISLKEIEMDKFERLERIVKKIGGRDQNSAVAGFTKLEFQPDKALASWNNILVEGEVYSNKSNGNWMTLFGKNSIPDKGLYYFEVELVKWTNRQLMMGIGSSAVKNLNTSYGQGDSICLHLQNNNMSSLYDRGTNSRTGSFGTYEEGDRLICKINLNTSIISWCFANETICFTKITKDLRAKQLFIKVQFLYSTEKIKFV